MTTTDLGLYSISVRGLAVPELVTWAARAHIPFLHLRGGPRGYDLARRETSALGGWRRLAEDSGVPITGVTADLDLADIVTGPARERAAARAELARLAEAATALGAGWVRLLAANEPTGPYPHALSGRGVPALPVRLLVEPHHPGWHRPTARAALVALLERTPGLRLLADTAQLATAPAFVELLAHADVLHLSDRGAGLDDAQRRLARLVAARIAAGQHVETAVEWTGTDRSPSACLRRYRAIRRWWGRLPRPD